MTIRRWSGHGSRVEAVEFGGDGDSVVVSGRLLLIVCSCLVWFVTFCSFWIIVVSLGHTQFESFG